MPPGCFLSKLFSQLSGLFLQLPPSERHCAPLHHHQHHQHRRSHFLFTTSNSRLLIKAILATLLLTSVPDIRPLFRLPTLPTATKLHSFSSFFSEAHLLPSHANGGTSVNASSFPSTSALAHIGQAGPAPPLLPLPPLTPSVIISSQAAKPHDDRPIADFEVPLFCIPLGM